MISYLFACVLVWLFNTSKRPSKLQSSLWLLVFRALFILSSSCSNVWSTTAPGHSHFAHVLATTVSPWHHKPVHAHTQIWDKWTVFLCELLDTMWEPSGSVTYAVQRWWWGHWDIHSKALHFTSLGPSWGPAQKNKVIWSLKDLCRWRRTKGQKQLISFKCLGG